MSTLHLCHWHNIKHLKKHLGLLSDKDSLLIFGDFTAEEINKLHELMINFSNPWYLVKSNKAPTLANPDMTNEINHDQWLELVLQHNNTYAWK